MNRGTYSEREMGVAAPARDTPAIDCLYLAVRV